MLTYYFLSTSPSLKYFVRLEINKGSERGGEMQIHVAEQMFGVLVKIKISAERGRWARGCVALCVRGWEQAGSVRRVVFWLH